MLEKTIVKSILPLIDKWLNFQTYYKELPGISAGIYFEDEVIFTKSYGYSNIKQKEKATPQTMYRIASHSKLFTATLIMRLYERGKLSLDDKINKYLPWLPEHKTEEIRIRHLLTHSSGLTRDSRFGQWFHHEFPQKEDFISAINAESKIFEPNMFFKYSNIAYTLLGFIIEAISQKTYQENIDELVKELNMNNTIHDYSDEFSDKHATGYTRKFPKEERKEFQHVRAHSMSSATGLSSNVEDLLKFYDAHFLGNNKLLSDTYKRDMQQIHFVDSKKNIEWGIGFSKMNTSKIKFNGHGGGYPGFITRSGFNQEKKLIIVVLTNAIDGPALELFDGIANIINYAIINKENFISKAVFTDLDRFSGFYRNNWNLNVFQKVQDLYMWVNLLVPMSDLALNILEQKSGDSFILPEGNGFDNAGEELIIKENQESIKVQYAGSIFEKFDLIY